MLARWRSLHFFRPPLTARFTSVDPLGSNAQRVAVAIICLPCHQRVSKDLNICDNENERLDSQRSHMHP
uniref:Secreted protein n=1 Tax=Steinernema glaseri TaxID=37863 RepID=A0A1I7YL29_9BILA